MGFHIRTCCQMECSNQNAEFTFITVNLRPFISHNHDNDNKATVFSAKEKNNGQFMKTNAQIVTSTKQNRRKSTCPIFLLCVAQHPVNTVFVVVCSKRSEIQYWGIPYKTAFEAILFHARFLVTKDKKSRIKFCLAKFGLFLHITSAAKIVSYV